MGQLIADIEKNSREIIRVEVTEFKGRELINLRIWYSDFDGSYKPTQKGVAIDINHYDKLKDAVLKIGEYIEDSKKGSVPDINVKSEDLKEEDDEDLEESDDDVNEEPSESEETKKGKKVKKS
jgi:Ran GTPase-activating protein (RanGAP) involved in mRNA processing and transport